MREIGFVLAALLILAGVGGWIASTTTRGKVEYRLHHGSVAVGGGLYALPLLD
jgi:hypothetical protein